MNFQSAMDRILSVLKLFLVSGLLKIDQPTANTSPYYGTESKRHIEWNSLYVIALQNEGRTPQTRERKTKIIILQKLAMSSRKTGKCLD